MNWNIQVQRVQRRYIMWTSGSVQSLNLLTVIVSSNTQTKFEYPKLSKLNTSQDMRNNRSRHSWYKEHVAVVVDRSFVEKKRLTLSFLEIILGSVPWRGAASPLDPWNAACVLIRSRTGRAHFHYGKDCRLSLLVSTVIPAATVVIVIYDAKQRRYRPAIGSLACPNHRGIGFSGFDSSRKIFHAFDRITFSCGRMGAAYRRTIVRTHLPLCSCLSAGEHLT